MNFGNIKSQDFFTKISAFGCFFYPFGPFIMMLPTVPVETLNGSQKTQQASTHSKKERFLKNAFKPVDTRQGLLTHYGAQVNANLALRIQAESKMLRNVFSKKAFLDQSSASLKFHISLNNMANLDENIVLGLIEFLSKEVKDPKNDLSYKFKCINPERITETDRFLQNDQFTIYFDPYSSLGDALQFAEKIKNYLLERGVVQNSTVTGPKDIITLNNFVSARFDQNKLLGQYGRYSFFDLVIKHFLEKHPYEDLTKLPIGIIEAVFNTMITSPNIQNLQHLSKKENIWIQNEFEKALQDPFAYLKTTKVDFYKKLLAESRIEDHEKIQHLIEDAVHEIAPDLYKNTVDERTIQLEGSSATLMQLMRDLMQSPEKEREFLTPIPTKDGKYITSEGTMDRYIDPRIFRETQIKRIARWLSTTPPLLRFFFSWLFIKKMKMKLEYFDQNENQSDAKMYKMDPIIPENKMGFSMHNLGHATQLIQTSGMNILTDPVFGDLAPVVYPAMNRNQVQPEDLPRIDAILISHNHRDHVDEASLRKIIKHCKEKNILLPKVFVPLGDTELFKKMGFESVHAVGWHEQVTIKNPRTHQEVNLCGVPADHRSGRTGFDGHHSLVMGWMISPKDRKETLYFAGDTARVSDVRMTSLALNILQLWKEKKLADPTALPCIVNMEPGGPNYTRKDMRPTHQSGVDSIVSAFRLAVALEDVSKKVPPQRTAAQWLDTTATVFMHHNKFELGPDRFNENVFVFNRLISYLKMDDQQLEIEERKQSKKDEHFSLFHRRKDFIIAGVKELNKIAEVLWPQESLADRKIKILNFIQARTHFPLIQQRISSEEAFQFNMGEKSTIVPDTLVQGKGKLKGSKEQSEGDAPLKIIPK